MKSIYLRADAKDEEKVLKFLRKLLEDVDWDIYDEDDVLGFAEVYIYDETSQSKKLLHVEYWVPDLSYYFDAIIKQFGDDNVKISEKIVTKTACVFDDLYNEYLKKINKMSYECYLNTKHWKHFREEAIKYFRKCCLCSSQYKLNVHHNNYDNLGMETFNDVAVLCGECHSKFHD